MLFNSLDLFCELKSKTDNDICLKSIRPNLILIKRSKIKIKITSQNPFSLIVLEIFNKFFIS
jgi:hypothetical protein